MNNQIQALAMLPKLSEQQLMQALQSGQTQLPTYALMAELQARKKAKTMAAGMAGPPANSVKNEMMNQPIGMAGGGLLDAWNTNAPLGPALWDWLKKHHQRVSDNLGTIPEPVYDTPPGKPLREHDRTPVDKPTVAGTPKKSESPSGLRSIGASVKAPVGTAPANVPFTPNMITMGSLGDAMKQVPDDPTLREQMADLRSERSGMDKRRKDAGYEALITAGLGMASSPGRFGHALAQGGLRGMQNYQEQMRALANEDLARSREMSAVARAMSDQGLQRAGIGNQARVADANLALGNEKNRTDVYQTQQRSRDVDATNAARLAEARIMASARTAGGSDRLTSLLLKAQTDAERDLKGSTAHTLAMMPGASPLNVAKYQNELRQKVDANMRQLSITHPEVWAEYMRLRGGDAPAPSIIREGGLPQGAVIRN